MSDKLLPPLLTPVLAEIQHISSLGVSSWCEVVYQDILAGKPVWSSYGGIRTFEDGGKVLRWVSLEDAFSNNLPPELQAVLEAAIHETIWHRDTFSTTDEGCTPSKLCDLCKAVKNYEELKP